MLKLDGKILFISTHGAAGEGNGNPLLYSCLENPRDGGAWWAAVYGVAQNRTRLKRLGSSSSVELHLLFLYIYTMPTID